ALTIAEAVIRRYAREKENRGLLDFDDLIEKTLALLENVEAAWVHYKLDLGIDHVLIDEAQDTARANGRSFADLPRSSRPERGCTPREAAAFLRSVTKSSRSSRSKAPRRKNLPTWHGISRLGTAMPSSRSAIANYSSRSARATAYLARSIPCLRDLQFSAASRAIRTAFRRTSPCPEKPPASSRFGRRSRRSPQPRSRPGTRRSTNPHSPVRR